MRRLPLLPLLVLLLARLNATQARPRTEAVTP